MAVLLLANHDNASLSDATAKALTAALALEGPVEVLVAGDKCRAVAEAAAALRGVARVRLAEDPTYAHALAEPLASLILELAPEFDAIIAPSTSDGRNVLPRVAALLDTVQISDATAVLGPRTFERPVFAGNAVQRVEVTTSKVVATIRTTAFEAAPGGGSATIEPVVSKTASYGSDFVRQDIARSERPELTSARIVVSGGRALGSKEAFETQILPLADALGGAAGASRAAVDSGFAPNDWQVGQTGKVVAPELYIAVGISGAIQHLAGMKDSKVIVAINKDEEAPIFQVADIGLVGDLFTVLPELTAAISAARG